MVATVEKELTREKLGDIQFLKSLARRRRDDLIKQTLITMIPSRSETKQIILEQEIRKQTSVRMTYIGRKPYGQTILRTDLPKRLIRPGI